MESLARTANRGSVSTGYDVDNSCKFEDANSEGLHKSLSSQSRDTFTISFWLKRTALGAQRLVGAGASGNNEVIIHFTSSNQLEFYSWEGAYAMRYKTNRVFRDTSSWYHFAFLVDTTQATASERTQIYVNGVLETSFAAEVQPGQNAWFDWTTNIYVGKAGAAADADMSGYLAEFVYLDDTKAAHTDLGEFDSNTGIWKPIDVSGLTFGTNGAYLDFKDSSNMGNDANGGTDFTETNITAADQATDTPTNNFATFNAINMTGNSATLKEGATFVASVDNSAYTTYGTMAPSSGKWWWEGKIQVFESSDAYACIGVTTNLAGLPSVSAQLSGGHCIKLAKAQKWVLNDTGYSYGAAYADADIINVGLDLDNKKFYTYKNGTIDDANGIDISSTTFDGFGSQWMPLVITYGSGGASSYEINFGGYRTYSIGSATSDANGYGTFEYAPPSGYYALCSKNLAEYG